MKIKWNLKPKESLQIEAFVEEKNINRFPSLEYCEENDYDLRSSNGKEVIYADFSGVFNDVFILNNFCLKFHSRDWIDELSIGELFHTTFNYYLRSDAEVSRILGFPNFVPVVYGEAYDEKSYTRLSIVEFVNGETIDEVTELDTESLKAFLLEAFECFAEKELVVLDLHGNNIVLTEDGYKLIDLSTSYTIQEIVEQENECSSKGTKLLIRFFEDRKAREEFADLVIDYCLENRKNKKAS